MQLPDDLRDALAAEVGSGASRHLAGAAQSLSRRYRAGHARSTSTPLESPLDARAYAAYRMPATYAALAAAFGETQDRLPRWTPHSMLDVGGGPGTAAWAAATTWPELADITILERDGGMAGIGTALATHAGSLAVQRARWRRVDITGEWGSEPAGLTAAGYVLGEPAPEARAQIVERLWQHTDSVCVIVEPGTPRGYEVIREATHGLIRAGASVIAPVPPTWPCLENETDWLHFSERVGRTRVQRVAKDATLAYEDEKFCYLVASRWPGEPFAARVIRHPQIRSGHVRLTVCTPAGIRHLVIPRSRKETYRKARDLHWGSAIEPDEANVFGL
jgi:ribosomal protein RSM22 (predicted rRNA methylase)